MTEIEDSLTKNCEICGDKAIGHNFAVLSCESCKHFFRRHAFKIKVFQCLNGGDCDITKTNRNSCRYCRLNKCLLHGMKKEWILSAEQKKVRKSPWQRRDKVFKSEKDLNESIDNRKGNQTIYSISQMYNTINEMLVSDSDQIMKDLSSTPVREETPSDTKNKIIILSDNKLDHKRSFGQSLDGSPVSVYSMSESEDTNSDLELQPSTALVPIPRPITDYNNNFTEIEGNYLTELLVATNRLKTPIGTITSEAVTFNDAIQVLHFARRMDVQRLASIPNSLKAFKDIRGKDRFEMIRMGLMEMHHLRSVSSYLDDGNMQYMIVPTINDKSSSCLVPLDVIRQTKPYLFEATKNFYQVFASEWDSDHVILDLMLAINLFNPDRTNDYQAIKAKQQIYCQLLQRYLLLKYRSEEKATEKYSRLMTTISLVNILRKKRQINSIEENYCNSRSDYLNLVKSVANNDLHQDNNCWVD